MIFALSDNTLNSSFSRHQNFDSDFLVANFSFIAESNVKLIKHSYCCDVRQAGFSDSEYGFTYLLTYLLHGAESFLRC